MARKSKDNKSFRLKKIQGLVRASRYILTNHAYEPIEDGDIDRNDLECSIKNGVITKIQNDEKREATDLKKYTIVGPTFSGLPISTVGKIIDNGAGEEYLLITAYIHI